jgi:uncharacterized protein (TIRG00374 family)
MKWPNHLARRVFWAVAATIVLYVLLAAITGWRDFRTEIGTFPLSCLPLLVLLSALNYGFRYVRWEIYLQTLGIRLVRSESLALFLATFVMVVTPAKLGEAFKAGILRERYKVPLATGLPVILAERLFDFLAIFVLAGVGLFFWSGSASGLTIGLSCAALILVFFAVLRSRSLRQALLRRAGRTPYLKSHQLKLEEAMNSMAQLIAVRISLWSLLLSILAWGAECVSLWVVCRATETPLSLLVATFIYAAATLVGSLTFLPGGLGGTEITLIGLLKSQGIPNGTSVSISLIVRVVTLWLAVAIGLVAFGLSRKIFWNHQSAKDNPREEIPVSKRRLKE